MEEAGKTCSFAGRFIFRGYKLNIVYRLPVTHINGHPGNAWRHAPDRVLIVARNLLF